MNWLPWKGTPTATRSGGMPILLITNTFESALEVLPPIEREGTQARIVPVGNLVPTLEFFPAPMAVLLLRELPTDGKMAACRFVRSHPQLRHLPVAAVCTLLDHSSDIPADIIMRPPESLRDAVRALLALAAERQQQRQHAIGA